jgi:hypothetical protein
MMKAVKVLIATMPESLVAIIPAIRSREVGDSHTDRGTRGGGQARGETGNTERTGQGE